MNKNAYKKITDVLGPNLDFSSPDTSLSPMYSNVGLCFEEKGEIKSGQPLSKENREIPLYYVVSLVAKRIYIPI